jgi:hypothetical protein
MIQQYGPLFYTISIWALPAIIAITFHEAAHGFAAQCFGDDTAWHADQELRFHLVLLSPSTKSGHHHGAVQTTILAGARNGLRRLTRIGILTNVQRDEFSLCTPKFEGLPG